MSWSYDYFNVSGFSTGDSGIQINEAVYLQVSGLKYDGITFDNTHLEWLTGIGFITSGTIGTPISGNFYFDPDLDHWEIPLVITDASEVGKTGAGTYEWYWNSGGSFSDVDISSGISVFANANADRWNTITNANISVDNADLQHSHSAGANRLSDLEDVARTGAFVYTTGYILMGNDYDSFEVVAFPDITDIDPTGYETISGDYLILSGTVDDYIVVSGVAVSALQNIVEDITPQLGGQLDLNQKSIVIDPTPTSNNTFNGIIITGTVDDASTVYGNLLYKAADGNWERADASAVATLPCHGMALEAGAGSKGILLYGVIRHDDWNWSQVGGTGDLLYVSETPGDPTQTIPSGSSVNVQVIGFALSDDEIMFKPDNAYATWES